MKVVPQWRTKVGIDFSETGTIVDRPVHVHTHHAVCDTMQGIKE